MTAAACRSAGGSASEASSALTPPVPLDIRTQYLILSSLILSYLITLTITKVYSYMYLLRARLAIDVADPLSDPTTSPRLWSLCGLREHPHLSSPRIA